MTLDSSLAMPDVVPCAFCQYLSGERPYTIVERNPITAVLVTREQRGIGHCLVIPLAHRESILDLTEAESREMMQTIRRVATAIDREFERPGIAIWQNNGLAAHQSIPHMHFHVAGTLPGGGTDFGSVPELTVGETDLIGEIVRKGLESASGIPH